MLATFIMLCLHTDCDLIYSGITAMFLVQILPYADNFRISATTLAISSRNNSDGKAHEILEFN